MMSAPRYTLSRKELQKTRSEQKSYIKPELDHIPDSATIREISCAYQPASYYVPKTM